MATLDLVSVASDIAAAATALAGLILVYLGAVAVRYETLNPTDNRWPEQSLLGCVRLHLAFAIGKVCAEGA